MRAIQPELQARLDGGATRLCRCWLVRRHDDVALGFTDHDADVTFDGVLFRARSGMDASALESATGLSVDNGQAMGALTSAAVSEADVLAGKYDRAEIWHWLVDWERPDLRILQFRGSLGEIRRTGGAFEVELRGLAEALNAPVGRSLLRTCDRTLGDGRCGVDVSLPGLCGEGVVTEASGGDLVASGIEGYAEGWFAQGMLTWLSGRNAGESGGVKADVLRPPSGRRLALWQAPGFAVVAGDRFRIVAGCDKRAETCRGKFGNFLNFRGFPHVPGEDWVTAYPRSGGNHDGRSLVD